MKSLLLSTLLVGQVILFTILIQRNFDATHGDNSPDQTDVPALSTNDLETSQDPALSTLLNFERTQLQAEPQVPSSDVKSAAAKPNRKRKLTPAAVKLEQKLNTPEFLRAQWSGYRMSTWRNYRAFIKENHISAERIPRVVELITSITANSGIVHALDPERGVTDNVPYAAEIDANKALAEELGPETYAHFNEYSSNLTTQRQLGIYVDRLRSVGINLSEDQQKAFSVVLKQLESAKGLTGEDRVAIMKEKLPTMLPPRECGVVLQTYIERKNSGF